MKKMFFSISILIWSLCFLQAQELFIVNSNSCTLSKVNIENYSVNNSFALLGEYANQVIYDRNKLYVVNSGDNNIVILNSETGQLINTIQLGNSVNPWNILLHNEYAYVTGLFSGKVYKVELRNTQHIIDLDVGNAPQALAIDNGLLYVSITGGYPLYSESKIAIIDLNTFTVIDYIEVPTNPSEMVIDTNGFMHIICTGNYANTTSQVVIINLANREIVHTLALNWSFYSTIQLGVNNLIFVGNAYGLGFYTYNQNTFEVVNGYGNFLFAGCDRLLFDEDYLYPVKSDFYSASILYFYRHDYSFVRQISLAIGANSMAYKKNDVSIIDNTNAYSINLQVFPTPFNPEVLISFTLENPDYASLTIFNSKGQKIKSLFNAKINQGLHQFLWQATDQQGHKVASGVYFCQLIVNEKTVLKKMVLLK